MGYLQLNKIQEMETLLAELKDGTGDSESLAVSGDHSFMIAPIVNTLGYFYYNIGNKEEAKNLFEEYLNLYPDGASCVHTFFFSNKFNQ